MVADRAKRVLELYREHVAQFDAITNQAHSHFQSGNPQALWQDTVMRLDLYKGNVALAVADLTTALGPDLRDRATWIRLKRDYDQHVQSDPDRVLAETFFNSVTRKVFGANSLDPDVEFAEATPPPPRLESPFLRTFNVRGRDTPSWVDELLRAYAFVFEDHEQQVATLAQRITARWADAGVRVLVDHVEAWGAVFYRANRAHIVARMRVDRASLPLVIVAKNDGGHARIEAVLLHENDVSMLFGYTRAYFHVATPSPVALTGYLQSILPKKGVSELYSAVGYDRHGKTAFFRDLTRHLQTTTERFNTAPGTPGLVMYTFHLPGFPRVFKLVRDHFPAVKHTSRERVMSQYAFVFRRDRAGRLVEAQSFEHLTFARDRFAPEVLEELRTTCASSVRIESDKVLLTHCYIERQVTPLNLFMEQARGEDVETAIVDLGQCIKDLAATNVFPGDLLLKNFGVTNNLRVVFYDYDELQLLTDCNFRKKPQARTYEDELAAEPWYSVGENDIFPEELRTFLGLRGHLLQLFEVYHGDLFEPGYWKDVQAAFKAGQRVDVRPFRRRCLLQ